MENAKSEMSLEDQQLTCMQILLKLLRSEDLALEVDDETAEHVLNKMSDIFIYEKSKELFIELKEVVIRVRALMKLSFKEKYSCTIDSIIHKYLFQSTLDASLRLASVFKILMKLDPEHTDSVNKTQELLNGLHVKVESVHTEFENGMLELEKLKEHH